MELQFQNRKIGIFLFIVYGLIFYRAFFTFHFSYDYMWYHLPIALTHFGKTTYILTGFDKRMLEALPPLAHWVQGALASLTGMPHLGNAVNSVGLIAVTSCLRILRGPRFPVSIFWLGLLGIPIFVAQLYSGFIDAWGNLWLFLAYVSYLDMLEREPTGKNLFFFCLGSVFAVFSKYQMWPVVGLLYIFCLYEVIRTRRVGMIFPVIICALLMAVWPVRNFVLFGNPTYPYMAPGLNFLKKDMDVTLDTNKIIGAQIFEGFRDYPRPLLFLMSAFEVTRLIPNEYGMQWTYEQWAMGETKNPNFRMGGWSFLTVAFLIWIAVRAWRSKVISRRGMFAIGASIVLVSLLPQSYELRYYLFIPLVGTFLMTEFFQKQTNQNQKYLKIFLVASALLVLSSRAFLPFDVHHVEDYVTNEQRAFWDNPPPNSSEKPVCIKADPHRMLFWAGPAFNSVWVSRCAK